MYDMMIQMSDPQYHWLSGLFPLSDILNIRKYIALETGSKWSILRNSLLIWPNTNHCCSSIMLMTHLQCGITIHSSCRHSCHLIGLKLSIQFTMETESGNVIPLLDVLTIWKKTTLATKV
jgi:hypothetical protein